MTKLSVGASEASITRSAPARTASVVVRPEISAYSTSRATRACTLRTPEINGTATSRPWRANMPWSRATKKGMARLRDVLAIVSLRVGGGAAVGGGADVVAAALAGVAAWTGGADEGGA